jgi:hypothetical protein
MLRVDVAAAEDPAFVMAHFEVHTVNDNGVDEEFPVGGNREHPQ